MCDSKERQDPPCTPENKSTNVDHSYGIERIYSCSAIRTRKCKWRSRDYLYGVAPLRHTNWVIAFSGSICYTRVHNTKVIECVIRSSLSSNLMLLPALGFMICQNLARGSVNTSMDVAERWVIPYDSVPHFSCSQLVAFPTPLPRFLGPAICTCNGLLLYCRLTFFLWNQIGYGWITSLLNLSWVPDIRPRQLIPSRDAIR
jgi:hypothetical protein